MRKGRLWMSFFEIEDKKKTLVDKSDIIFSVFV